MTLTNAEKQRRWRDRRNRLARAFTETPAMFAETIVNECGIEHARKVARAIDRLVALNKRRQPPPHGDSWGLRAASAVEPMRGGTSVSPQTRMGNRQRASRARRGSSTTRMLGGTRRLKTFKRKKDADAWSDSTGVAVRDGTHVADSATVTVKDAGDRWIASAEAAGLERATIDQYRQHLNLHIDPFLGRLKLSQINAPTVRAFEDRLRADGRSPTMVRYVARSLGALLADAQERGLIVRQSGARTAPWAP